MDYIGRFLDQARLTPLQVAVADDRSQLSYQELERRSGSLAALLSARGVAAATHSAVAVLVPRTVDIVLSALGTMRAGGVYVPMDPAYPQDRLEFMLQDANAQIVLTVKDLWKSKGLDFPEEKVVFLDNPHPEVTFNDFSHNPEDPAYMLYTSGTTGRPKGVVHTHRSLLAMASQWEEPGFKSTGVVAGFTFIASAFMMFPPLISGGTCNIVPEYAKSDMNSLQDYVQKHSIQELFLPASLAAAMAEEFPLDGVTLFSAGEKLRNFKKKGGAVVINAYGSTEGVVVLAANVEGDELDIPLGAPCKGICVRIVDEQMADVPQGEIGELIYSGEIMAQAYLGLEEQTAAKWFVQDGLRWYHTGDRVRIGSDGFCHYVGRSDNMVKIRGFRVETGEVENCIRSVQPEIEDLAVVLRSIHGIDHLCCYYNASIAIDETRLKAQISQKLAEYMVPDIWMSLESFPRNPNGKILRGALPEPSSALESLSALYSEVELRVEEAARTVLGIEEPIDIDESFLSLGGDSITAMKMSAALSQQGIKVSASQILRLKILRKIAQEADVSYEHLWTPAQYSQVKYRFSKRGEKVLKVLPLTSAQDDMLYTELLFPDVNSNRSVYALDIDSSITEQELSSSVDKVAELNEDLRSAVVYQGVSVFQQVILDRKLPSSVVDLSAEPHPFKMVAEIYDKLLREPVDMEQSPAMETVYVRTRSRGCLLFRVLHASLGMDSVRRGITGVLEELLKFHPQDKAMQEWVSLMEYALENESVQEKTERKTSSLAGSLTGKHQEIAVFSEGEGQKQLVFVHTGNTGSDAYYQLADKIGGICGFSVIEPYNLYNPEKAIDGIKAIAAKYVEILRGKQPQGPYFLGGWCYGGVVAHEMACQLEAAGEKVDHLVLLDSHLTVDSKSKKLFGSMSGFTDREYFERSPLFADLRAQGLLESIVTNSRRVARDLQEHQPSVFHGKTTYFKPKVVPSGISGESLKYWQEMMKRKAGNFELYCTDIEIINTPHEHDLMMDKESLEIIVPEITKLIYE